MGDIMKIKNVIINILPLLIWYMYYCAAPKPDMAYILNCVETVCALLIIPIAYSIYNSFSKNTIELVTRNTVFIISHTVGCYINDFVYIKNMFGNIYLQIDEITGYVILTDLAISVIFFIIRLVLIKKKVVGDNIK